MTPQPERPPVDHARVWAQVLHIMRVLKEHPLSDPKERKHDA